MIASNPSSCLASTSRTSTRISAMSWTPGTNVHCPKRSLSRPTTSCPAPSSIGIITVPMYPLWPLTRTRIGLHDHLSAVERLGVASLRLDPAQPQERQERVRGEPVVVLLRLEAVHEDPDLLLAGCLVELNEEIGVTDVAVVLQDLVLEDEVIPVRIPRQLRHQAMVLVEIVAIRREDDVRRRLDLQPFEEFLDALALVREEPIPEIGDDDFLPLRARQNLLGARDGFLGPPPARPENDPADTRLLVLAQQPQDRPAAADLDVITVRAET